jgi:glycine/D-amino acid oxidase-like deaminating enzyme
MTVLSLLWLLFCLTTPASSRLDKRSVRDARAFVHRRRRAAAVGGEEEVVRPSPDPTTPWWLNGAPYQNATSHPLPSSADVVIVGAGITGASIAYHLRELTALHSRKGRGLGRVVVVDARGAAGGATGRNGGQCCVQDSDDFAALEEERGLAHTLRERSFQLTSVDAMRRFMEEHDAGWRELRWEGAALPAQTLLEELEIAEGVRTMHRHAEACPDRYCGEVEWWDAATTAARLGSAAEGVFRGAAFGSNSGSLWPAKIVFGLLDLALLAPSITLHTHTAVVSIQPGSQGRWQLTTAGGEQCLATSVVVATNAYTSGLLPQFRDVVIPAKNQVFVTAPLPPLNPMLVSINDDYEYFMQRRDGRVVIGGGRLAAGDDAWMGVWDDSTTNTSVSQHLIDTLHQMFPQVSVEIEQEWSGIIGVSVDGMPWVGRVPGTPDGLFVAAGFSGAGMTHSFGAGRAMAQLLLGMEPDDFFEQYEPDFPGRWTAARRTSTVDTARFGSSLQASATVHHAQQMQPSSSRAAVAAAAAPAACTDDHSCSLNGRCSNGSCECDAAWSGSPQCDVLAVLPSRPGRSGYHNISGASWGGNVIGPVKGKFHLFVAQMVMGCGLERYGTNSAIVRAEAADPSGPFVWQEVVRRPFAHNPTIRQLPNGAGYVIFFIGGNNVSSVDCHNETRDELLLTTYANRTPHQLVGGSIHAIHAQSVFGPWSQPVSIEFDDGGSNTSAWVGGGTNPSPVIEADGSVTLAVQREFRASPPTGGNKELIGVARAKSWRGPYTMITTVPVKPEHPGCVAGTGEGAQS